MACSDVKKKKKKAYLEEGQYGSKECAGLTSNKKYGWYNGRRER